MRAVLDETGCRPEWLTLELTESLMVGEPDRIRRIFEDLRLPGVRIAIDDFGTAYANLRYPESFPVTEIKVDRSFVHNAAHSVARRVIVEGVVKPGAALNIRVVAEGIETEAERTIMRAPGCAIGQGFYFAEPMEEAQFRALLEGDRLVRERWAALASLTMLGGGSE